MDVPPLRYGTVSIASVLSIRYRITKYCGGRMNDDSGHRTWIDAGLKEIGQGGVAQVRVQGLAQRLAVPKGVFSRRFKDARALLAARLETWSLGRIAAVERQTALGDESAAGR